VTRGLNGKPLKGTAEDGALPICWKGTKPFKAVRDVKDYFEPLLLSFTKNVQLHLPPENYLIVTKHGNVCLGILNGSEVGLENFNIIGGKRYNTNCHLLFYYLVSNYTFGNMISVLNFAVQTSLCKTKW
jgi:hypothetical protein